MEFLLNRPYRLPDGEDPSWFRAALQDVLQRRLPPIRIGIALRNGITTFGTLEATDEGLTHDSYGNVYLGPPNARDQLQQIPCEDIAGFTLHGEPPIDQSDELRGRRAYRSGSAAPSYQRSPPLSRHVY